MLEHSNSLHTLIHLSQQPYQVNVIIAILQIGNGYREGKSDKEMVCC